MEWMHYVLIFLLVLTFHFNLFSLVYFIQNTFYLLCVSLQMDLNPVYNEIYIYIHTIT